MLSRGGSRAVYKLSMGANFQKPDSPCQANLAEAAGAVDYMYHLFGMSLQQCSMC
jgi:hypothetical protein